MIYMILTKLKLGYNLPIDFAGVYSKAPQSDSSSVLVPGRTHLTAARR